METRVIKKFSVKMKVDILILGAMLLTSCVSTILILFTYLLNFEIPTSSFIFIFLNHVFILYVCVMN